MLKKIYILMLMLTCSAEGQHLSVFDLDEQSFPKVKAKLYAVDALINPIYNLSINDFKIFDNETLKDSGKPAKILSITCPDPRLADPISSVLTIDISSSMIAGGPRIDFAKAGAETWVQYLNTTRSECAISSFNHLSYLNCDFTKDKNQLKNSINSLTPSGGTDYNYAFLDSMTGSINIAKKGVNKRIIVFLTDGIPSNPTDVKRIVSQAVANDITIYCIALGMPIPKDLNDIALKTTGRVFENLTKEEEVVGAFISILMHSQGFSPCEMEWIADSCNILRNAVIKLPSLNMGQNVRYSVLGDGLPIIKTHPYYMPFGTNITPGTPKDTTIIIEAKYGDVVVNNISSTNPKFEVFDYGGSEPPFILGTNQKRTLTIRYSPTDIWFQTADFRDTLNICSNLFFYCSAGFPEDTSSDSPSLKIEFPNGGERLMSCTDSIIRWSGVSAEDSISLEYSTNNGASWQTIVEKTAGLQYSWSVPDMIGSKYLVRAKHVPKNYINGADTTFIFGEGSFKCLTESPDHTKFAVGTYDSHIIILDKSSGSILKKWRVTKPGRHFPIEQIAWSPAGDKIAYSCLLLPNDSSGIGILNADNGEFMFNLSRSLGNSNESELKWSNSGELIAFSNYLNLTVICDSSGAVNKVLKEQIDAILSISWSLDDKLLATGSADSTIVIWDVETGLPTRVIDSQTRARAVSFSKNNYNFAYSSPSSIIIINPISGAVLKTFSTPSEFHGIDRNPNKILWSEDGSKIALFSSAADYFINVYSSGGGTLLSRLDLPPHPGVYDIIFNSSINELMVGFASSQIIRFNAVNGGIYGCIDTLESFINSISFNPDGSKVAVGYWDYIKIWDTSTKTVTRLIDNNRERIASVKWSPDGTKLAAASSFKEIKIWDPETGNIINKISDLDMNDKQEQLSSKLCWNSDGSELVTYSKKTVLFYNSSSMNLVRSLLVPYLKEMPIPGILSMDLSPYDNLIRLNISGKDGILFFIMNIADSTVLWEYLPSEGHSPCWNLAGNGIYTNYNTDVTNLCEFDVFSGNSIKNISLFYDDIYHIDLYRPMNIIALNTYYENKFFRGKNLQLIKAQVPENEMQVTMIKWCQDPSKMLAASALTNGQLMLQYIPSLQKPIVYDTSDAVFSINKPMLSSSNISMGQLLINQIKDTTFNYFIDNGSVYNITIDSLRIVGTDADCFSITSPTFPISVPANSGLDVEFNFHPNTIGAKTAVVEIFRQCDTIRKNIQGTGVTHNLKVLSSVIDFGKVKLGKHKDTLGAVTICNVSSLPISISSVKHGFPNDYDFSTLAGGGSFTLQPGDTAKLDLRFKPSSVGRTNGTLEFHYNSAGSPAIIQLFGEGMDSLTTYLKIVNARVDMGEVFVGENKDSLKVITITNIGSEIIEITETRFTHAAFQELTGIANFTLNPGDTTKIDLRFTPDTQGLFNGQIEFVYPNSPAPAVVELLGKGVEKDVVIQTNITSFENLICNYSSQALLTITNIGIKTLEIKHISFNDTTAAEFTIQETMPIVIEPDSAKTILVTFIPKTAGTKSVRMYFIANTEPDSVYIVRISARKDSVELKPQFDEIDLGSVCPGETQINTVRIYNYGTLKTGGRIELSSSLSTFVDRFELSALDNYELIYIYKADSTFGTFSEKITIIDSICGHKAEIIIKGIIEIPEIKADDLTISSLVGTSKEGQINISNNSGREIKITAVNGIAVPFELIAGQLPLIIPKGKSAELKINYLPTENKTDEIEILLIGEPCDISTFAKLKGIAANAGVELKTTDISAYAGEEIEVPIILSNKNNLEAMGITAIETDLEFNPTMLYPIGYNVEKINDKLAKIKLTDLSPNISEGEPVTKIKFIAALGNSDVCDLVLSNAKSIGGLADIRLVNGKFSLLGICREGGTRLINSEKYGQLLKVSPNPSTGRLFVEMNLFEKGETRLTIYSPSGETIFSKDINNQTGKLELNFETYEFASGTYYVNLHTPTLRKTVPVVVIR